jgi:hypothetical protein
VNRAFLELADLPERDTLVGRPVESIFGIASFVDPAASMTTSSTTGPKQSQAEDGGDQQGRPITNDRHLTGTVQVGRRRNQSLYRLRVLPVVDRSRRRRRVGDETTTAPSSAASFQCMSHVLIQIEPSFLPQVTATGPTPDQPMSSLPASYGGRPSIPLRPPTSDPSAVSGRAGMIG